MKFQSRLPSSDIKINAGVKLVVALLVFNGTLSLSSSAQTATDTSAKVFSYRPDWSLYVSLTLNNDGSFKYTNRMNLRTSAYYCSGTWTQNENEIIVEAEGKCNNIPNRWIIEEDKICTKKKESLMWDPLDGVSRGTRKPCLEREIQEK